VSEKFEEIALPLALLKWREDSRRRRKQIFQRPGVRGRLKSAYILLLSNVVKEGQGEKGSLACSLEREIMKGKSNCLKIKAIVPPLATPLRGKGVEGRQFKTREVTQHVFRGSHFREDVRRR